MKFRVSAVTYDDDATRGTRDVSIAVDVTATVGEVARSLVRAGAGRPELLPYATERNGQITLLVTFPDGSRLVLDAGDPIAHAGLYSGSQVEPLLETAGPGDVQRVKEPVGMLTVVSGPQLGTPFLLVAGETTIGRDRSSRIEMRDPSVSRRHAVIRRVGAEIEIQDLGSTNGIALLDHNGERIEPGRATIRISRTSLIELGEVTVRIEVGPPAGAPPGLFGTVLHLQAPQVDPVFSPEEMELPSPPEPGEPTRFPLIAMVAPLLMGTVLFITTHSVMSLIFIGLSPIIMIGSWLDNCLTKRTTLRAKRAQFETSLERAERELVENRVIEQRARAGETPPAAELARLPESRGLRLWSRRPEHRAFLELKLGDAQLQSRKGVVLPARGQIEAGDWDRLVDVHTRFRTVPEVPLLERLDRSGSLGIVGDPFWAAEAARAVLVQLLSQHSPASLVFTAFAAQGRLEYEWAWLKWLPHVDSIYSPIHAPHLVADERSASILLTALEGLIRERGGGAHAVALRSYMDGSAAEARERLSPPTSGPHYPAVIVFVLADEVTDRTRLVGLAEDGPDVGVHVIWVGRSLGGVPAACRTVVEAYADTWRAHFVRQGEVTEITRLDTVGQPVAERFGRALAPIEDAGARALDESDLPRSVALAQIMSSDILGGADAIVRNWTATDSLTSRWTPGAERDAGLLEAVVGQGSAEPVALDLRTHGPHALVGGTTGSGKSEFLQAWIFSLAAHYAPDRLTFLLVDYKGGAAFADCVELPHTVGLVTDLNTHLVRRALVSLRAELRYREEVLADKGAKDLIALERRGDPDAPPALVIVIDEFAALVNEIPEFVDGVIDVAQRGRSLGLHLVMATQRPAGVITDNLRANTNLRIALRMADHADSSDVIGVADAALFSPDTPGRAAVKVGAGQLTHFQSGYLGGRSDADHREAVEVRDLGFGGHAPWALVPETLRTPARARKGPRDIEALAANIQRAAAVAGTLKPRPPWVDQLPSALPLAALPHTPSPQACAAGVALPAAERRTIRPGLTIALGLRDEPHLQRQTAYQVAFDEIGNLAVFGGSGSGKSTALITAVCAALRSAPNTQVYGIDAANGRLGVLDALPCVGGIIDAADRDRVLRLLGRVRGIMTERSVTRQNDPPVLFLFDGFSAFRDSYEHLGGGDDPFGDLTDIAQRGRTVGVHLLITSERSSGMPMSLAPTVSERLVLRQPSDNDYNALGVPKGILEDSSPGRVLRIGSDEEIQLAMPGAGTEPADTDAAIREVAAAQEQAGIVPPAGVPPLPTELARADIAEPQTGGTPFAIDTVHLAPVAAPEEGLLLVTGPAGSGRTTAIRSLLAACAEGESQPLDAVLISPRRSSLREALAWDEVADSATSRERVIAWLTEALGGQLPQSGALQFLPLIGTEPADPPGTAPAANEAPRADRPFPEAGRRGVVVIEDIGGFDGSGDEGALAHLLKLLRRADLTTIVEGENATLGAVWELAAPLRGARWALALQPDANDQPSLFTAPFTHSQRADFPPGRGLLVRNGKQTGIHIGLP